MKTLFLLRHATPASTRPGESDFDRCLEPRGFREAEATGETIRFATAELPGIVLCSSARRTLETLEGLRASLETTVEVSCDRELYCASRDQLLQRIREIDDAHASALVIAHNPGIAVLAGDLAARGDTEALQRMATRFPPSSLAILRFSADRWGELRSKTGELVDFTTPRDY